MKGIKKDLVIALAVPRSFFRNEIKAYMATVKNIGCGKGFSVKESVEIAYVKDRCEKA